MRWDNTENGEYDDIFIIFTICHMVMRNLEVKAPGSSGNLNVADAKVGLVESRNSDGEDIDENKGNMCISALNL